MTVKKFQYTTYKTDNSNADSKAKNDVSEILLKNDFLPICYPSKYKYIRYLQQYLSLYKINRNVVIAIQYPTIKYRFVKLLLKRIKKSKYSIAIIHDLELVRNKVGTIKDEIKILNNFDCIIVHNNTMKNLFEKNGYKGRIKVLEVFDYLINLDIENSNITNNTIIFAGNLDKSKFIYDLKKIKGINFNVYGKYSGSNFSDNYVQYKGMLSSTEIVSGIDGTYGLVWDGDSIYECGNIFGEYLKYNSPHKLSLYIVAGKPVITWKQAAIADFVVNNNIGIVVESLKELEKIDLMENYYIYKNNILKIKKDLINGNKLSNILEEIQYEYIEK